MNKLLFPPTSQTNAMDATVSCPFCPFSSPEHYYVIEHVECCHSELGDSPFIVKEDDEDRLQQRSEPQPRFDRGSSFAPSDGDYIECECGELVLLREFTNHSSLHELEGATADLIAPSFLSDSLHSVSANSKDLHLISMPSNDTGSSARSTCSVASQQRVYAGHHKTRHGIKNAIDGFLGSPSSPPHSKAGRQRGKTPRRLGVCDLYGLWPSGLLLTP